MTRDKAGQGFVAGFLEAASRTALVTEGNLPGGGGLFAPARRAERPAEQARLALPCDCPRCSGHPPCPDCDGDGAAPSGCPTCGKGVTR